MTKGKMSTSKAIKETLKKKKKKSAQQVTKTINESGIIPDFSRRNYLRSLRKVRPYRENDRKETKFIYFYMAGEFL